MSHGTCQQVLHVEAVCCMLEPRTTPEKEFVAHSLLVRSEGDRVLRKFDDRRGMGIENFYRQFGLVVYL